MSKTKEELIKEIDDMSYRELLTKWRFTPAGSPYFQGIVGEHFMKQMDEKAPSNISRVSKDIGWDE